MLLNMPKQTKTCFQTIMSVIKLISLASWHRGDSSFEDQLTQPDLLENQKKTFCRNQDKLNQTLGSFDWQTLKTEIFRSKLTSQLEIVRSFIMEREKLFLPRIRMATKTSILFWRPSADIQRRRYFSKECFATNYLDEEWHKMCLSKKHVIRFHNFKLEDGIPTTTWWYIFPCSKNQVYWVAISRMPPSSTRSLWKKKITKILPNWIFRKQD